MKKLSAAILSLLLLFCIVGCRDFPVNPEEEESPSLARTNYRIEAELSPKEHLLKVRTEIDYASPADDLSAIKLRLYANAYREGCTLVTSDKLSAVYPAGEPSYGSAEVHEVTCDLPITASDLGQQDSILTLRLGRQLKRGELLHLCITETVILANARHRLGYDNGYFFLSNFYPEVCPFENGKYLTYEHTPYGDPFRYELADFSLALTLPAGYECACSSIEDRRERQGTFVTYHHTLKGARDIAVVASEHLRYTSDSSGKIPIRYYTSNASDSRKILDLVKEAIALYEDLFGSYPYPSYTIVSAPFFEAGVEHSGMGVVSNGLPSYARKKAILHETAHQWWFGKVGNDEYRHPWLDEGLTEYTVAYYYKQKGAEDVYRELIGEAEDSFSIRLALTGSEGTRFDLPLPDLNEGYYDRVYCGGLLLFSSLAEIVGFDDFHEALRAFAEEYADKIATPKNLTDVLSRVLKKDYAPFFRSWVSAAVPVQ